MPPTETDAGAEALVPFVTPCHKCASTGALALFSCPACDLHQRLHGLDTPKDAWPAARLSRVRPPASLPQPQEFPRDPAETYPCGHPLRLTIETPGAWTTPCPRCDGTGRLTALLPPAEAAHREQRREEKQRRARKLAQSQYALLTLRLHGARAARDLRPPCEARTRQGRPCIAPCVYGRLRCENHGISDGPRTAEGRDRIREANRRRWAAWRDGRNTCQNP